jgi:hypothetical protein
MKSRPLTLSRRRFLRGAGGACMALPLSALEGPALGAGYSKRLIVMYTPDGGGCPDGGGWGTTGTESNPVLGQALKPLEALKSDLIFLTGIHNKSAHASPRYSSGHYNGWCSLLTGVKGLGSAGGPGVVGGISIDQYLARQLGPKPYRSIDLHVYPKHGTMGSLGPNQRVAAETNPVRAYDRFLGGVGSTGGTPDPVAERLRRSRRGIVDGVARELKALSLKLPIEDRMKLEAHADSMNEVSQELQAIQAVCDKSTRPTVTNVNSGLPTGGGQPTIYRPEIPAMGKAFMDILVKAMACDLTQFGGMGWLDIVNNDAYKWVGPDIDKCHHCYSHEFSGSGNEKYLRCSAWFAEQFAYLVRALKGVQEGSGTMLDNTLVVWTSEHGFGAPHSYTHFPFTLAGRCGGYFRTGRLVSAPDRTNNDLCVNIATAMGVPITTFGDPTFCTGAISALH